MKKLMIAAAAVAMIGAAEASITARYDFVANLETTKGAVGADKETLIPYQVKLGVHDNDPDQLWYNDPLVLQKCGCAADTLVRQWVDPTEFSHLVWDTVPSKIGGTPHPVLKIVPTTFPDGRTMNILDENERAFLKDYLEPLYDNQSFGYWCLELDWFSYDFKKARCYRVSGTEVINTQIFLDRTTCCTRGTGAFTTASGQNAVIFDDGIVPGTFLNRFGSQNGTEAFDLETYASVANVSTVSNGVFNGWLAGQGVNGIYDVSRVPDQWIRVDAPEQITGKIVGYTAAPVCPDCCVRPLPKTVAFACYDNTRVPADATPNAEGLPTAAYGTFYIAIQAIYGEAERPY